MFNPLRSLESQLSLKSKWESLKENEKIKILNFSREIGHRRQKQQQIRIPLCQMSIVLPCSMEPKEGAAGVESEGHAWLFSKEANMSQPCPKSRERDLPTERPERTVMAAGTEEVLGL